MENQETKEADKQVETLADKSEAVLEKVLAKADTKISKLEEKKARHRRTKAGMIDKEVIRILYHSGVSLAELQGMYKDLSQPTLWRIVNDGNTLITAEQTKTIMQNMAGKLAVKIIPLLEHIDYEKMEGASLSQTVIAIGILVEKVRLLLDQSTQITQINVNDKELMDDAKRIIEIDSIVKDTNILEQVGAVKDVGTGTGTEETIGK